MTNLNRLVEPLNAEVFVTIEEVKKEALYLADRIFNDPHKRRGRKYEQVFKSCFFGRIAEVGVRKLLNADDKLNIENDDWDVRDRNTYGHDLVSEGMRIEVKSQKGEWFDIPADGLKTLTNNISAKALDIVITASYEEKNDGYLVRPRIIIDPYKLHRYMKQSHYSDNKFFFDHHSALRAGDCIMVR